MKPPRAGLNRRDLFRAKAALRSDEPALSDASSLGDLLRASRPAMGSYFEIRLGAHVPGASDLAQRALDLIDTLESQLTVYRDDSELSLLNASAHLGPARVEPRLFSLLEKAVEIGHATRGAYDVTTGALSVAWGFFKGPKRVPDAETLAEARARTGQDLLLLDPEHSTVAFKRPGVIVNLGSIGKGYAIDRVAELIRGHWFPTTALVHGGRSSLYALGSPPGHFGDRWQIALHDPFGSDKPLGMVHLRNRAMGTSGATFQQFEVDGKFYGHILDPRTGVPADGPASVTVLAPTAAEADALSTAFYLLGVDEAEQWLKGRPDVGAIFVERGSNLSRPRVRTLNLGRADYSPGGI